MTDGNPLGDSASARHPDIAVRAPSMGAPAMKAFAHPLRMAIHRYLTDHGAATATTLARHLDESTGQTSYHLRQLARHGLIEEDTERGTGRERWWRSVGFSLDGAEMARDSANLPAVELIVRTQLQERHEATAEWLQRALQEPREWVAASLNNISTLRLTAAEATAMNQELTEVLHRYALLARGQGADAEVSSGETDPDLPAAEPRRVIRAYLDVFPLR